ncbi:MAG: hypothetical protein JNK05_01105 [Myxococcales bacterium]|nr:hypothetical protein [Myxococcales bacterium]
MAPRALASLVALATLTAAPAAFAQDYRLAQRDVTALTDALRSLFEGIRDGDVPKITAVLPTRAEFVTLYQPGTAMFIERHQRAIERDTRELRRTFEGGTFVSVDGAFAVNRTIRLERCGRFGARGSQCANGPVIEYRVGTATRRFRIDRVVRLSNGTWKIYDVRL